MPDPIQDLQKFGNGGIVTTPLDPARVRSLGDRRRTRRHAGIAAAAAAVMAAVIVPVAVLNHDDAKAGPPITSTPSPTPTPEVITYPEPGIEVVTPADTAKLRGTSREFKAFIGKVADQQAVDGAACPDAAASVTVGKYSSAGYAMGGVNSCGGYVTMWADLDSGWQQVMGGQEAFDCDELHYYGIPESFAGGCYDYEGDFGPAIVSSTGELPFDLQLRLGMDLNQLLADGGPTIDPVAGDGCATLTYQHLEKIKDQTDGYLSPNGGLVALFARPGMKTPEKIGLGSTLAELRAAYPDARHRPNGYWTLPIGGSDEYEFGIDAGGTVGEMVLTRKNQDCFG
jgi:hypothetical protein